MSRRKGDVYGRPIHCEHCGGEIVYCDGGVTGFMHEATRREHCADNLHVATALEVIAP